MACDDICYVSFSNVSNSVTDAQTILKAHSSSSFRDYFKQDEWNRTSEWISLKKGEPYYIEARHSEAGY
jgi:hypothetical protein